MSEIFSNSTEVRANDVMLELLDEGFIVQVKLTGQSMFPFLRNGDLANLVKCESRFLSKGDVIVFKNDHTYVAHRIIKAEQNGKGMVYTCKGDASRHFDEQVYEKDVIGRVISVERNNKVKYLQNGFLSLGDLYARFYFLPPFLASFAKKLGILKSQN